MKDPPPPPSSSAKPVPVLAPISSSDDSHLSYQRLYSSVPLSAIDVYKRQTCRIM